MLTIDGSILEGVNYEYKKNETKSFWLFPLDPLTGIYLYFAGRPNRTYGNRIECPNPKINKNHKNTRGTNEGWPCAPAFERWVLDVSLDGGGHGRLLKWICSIGIQLVKEICGANVTGLSLGSTDVEFHPGHGLRGGEYSADAVAGFVYSSYSQFNWLIDQLDSSLNRSVALLLQTALPATLFCDRPTVLHLSGGTNCEMAPQVDFSTEIFRQNLEKFGATFNFDLMRRG